MYRGKGSFLLILIICLWLGVYTGLAWAEIELGGKLETTIGAQINPDDTMDFNWREHLNLAYYLPRQGKTQAKFEIDIYYQPQGSTTDLNFYGDLSKLYLKHSFDQLQLTVGRQPISWSFGSLVNPFDYESNFSLVSPGMPAMSENALEAYIPLDWASGITAIVAFPEGSSEPKLALRGRTNLNGYDLSAHYLRNPATSSQGIVAPVNQEIGLTAKGDLGPLGFYMGGGYRLVEDEKIGKSMFLIGTDYSFLVNGQHKLMLQVEYLRDEVGKIQFVPGKPNLVVGTASYEIDDFAGIRLTSAVNPDDQSFVLMPEYHNLIGSSLDLSVQGTFFGGDVSSQFGSKQLSPEITIPQAGLEITLSYPF